MHIQQGRSLQSDIEEDQEVDSAPYVDTLMLSGSNQSPHRSVSLLFAFKCAHIWHKVDILSISSSTRPAL